MQSLGVGVRLGGRRVAELLLCLHPRPRPRSVAVCPSVGAARASGYGGPVYGVLEAAGAVCRGAVDGGFVVAVDDGVARDPDGRLLLFWTLRSAPARGSVAVVWQRLWRDVEAVAGREPLPPRRPPARWRWLVSVVLDRVGECWGVLV